jgi:hypothetical protein
VVLHLPDGDVPLDIWGTCWQSGQSSYCTDGAPPEHPVDVGAAEQVSFGFDEPGWTFQATFRQDGPRCPRSVAREVVATDATRFMVAPAGAPDRWHVDLFGRGPQGDVIATFQWRTTAPGHMPDAATGLASVLADHDGRLDSYGVGVALTDLEATPAEASAELLVTSAAGDTTTVDLRREEACLGAGTVSFRAPTGRGVEIAQGGGSAPFTYEARVELDGTTYVGTGNWPDDVVEGNEPNVALTWEPPLPVYRG